MALIEPGVYFSHVDFGGMFIDEDTGALGYFNKPPEEKEFTTKLFGRKFLVDLNNMTITREDDGEVRKITEITEFGMSFEAFKM